MSTSLTEFAIIADAHKSPITEVAEAHAEVHAEVQVAPLTKVELCLTVLAVLAILGFMHAAGAFLVPLLFAILISYTLSPAVAMLERLRMPRGLGALLMLSLVSTAIAALCYSLSSDVGKLTELVPRAASKVRELVRDQGGPASKPLANLQKAAKELEKAAAEATGEAGAAVRSRAAPAEGSVAHNIQQWLVAQTTHAVGIVLQLVTAMLIAFFLLAAGDKFRRKLARMAGPTLARRRVAISVLNTINAQIQRYMATIALTNVLIALATWSLLAYVGLDHALFLGALAGILHIIPYVGSMIAALIVGLVALVQFNDLHKATYLVLGVIAIAALIGVVLTAWVQSRAARINSVVLIAWVLFLGWLWEGWGLILAVPMLAVIKAISDGIVQLRPLAELLGE